VDSLPAAVDLAVVLDLAAARAAVAPSTGVELEPVVVEPMVAARPAGMVDDGGHYE
jgi:hypothetical protein